MTAITAILVELLQLLPSAIAAGIQVEGLIASAVGIAKSDTPPTDAQWAALDADMAQLRAQLNADPSPSAPPPASP